MASESLETAYRLFASGAWLDAEACARDVLNRQPDAPDASRLVGLAIAAMGEAERAAPALNHAAVLDPQAPHPCLQLAKLRPALSRVLVQRQFRACLRLSPTDQRLRLAMAEYLLDSHEPAEADAVLLGAQPSSGSLHLLGLARAEQGRFQSAAAAFRKAVVLDPGAAASWSNLGMVLKIEGRFDDAIAAHDRAVAIAPDNARFRVNRAVTLLKAGHWTAAWPDYECRLRLPSKPPIFLDRLLPSLSDGDDLSGQTIVALHEEGFGDTLQFLRYLPLLAERGARVIACVPPPLVRLVGGVPGVAQVVTDIRHLPAHDFVCPFFSLPRAFGTTVGTIPPPLRLTPDPAEIQRWRSRLPTDGLLVGLVWAGQSRPWLSDFLTLDQRRSIGLAAFTPLTEVPGLRFVSLQLGPASRQPPPAGMALCDLTAHIADFADTAELVSALDVVISVDTSVVHLAGLLAKRVFLLDRYDGCWRWLSGRSDSPWYPDLTIFRQDAPNDWSGPIQRVAASLAAMALFRGSGSTRAPHAVREPAFVG